MTPEQLEETYTDLCNRLTAIGDDRLSDGLARVALLLMNEIGDPARLSELFDDALSDMTVSDMTGARNLDGPWRETMSD